MGRYVEVRRRREKLVEVADKLKKITCILRAVIVAEKRQVETAELEENIPQADERLAGLFVSG